MRNKIFTLIAVMIFAAQCGFAKTIPVQALSDFTTENPPQTFSVKILDNLYSDDETILFKAGGILAGKITDVKDPKRLKRDATFSFIPETYKDENGNKSDVSGNYPAKYTTKISKAAVAKSAALGVGNYFVKGLSMGYSAIEGAVKNEKDNRFKSSVNSVYESSPLSLVKKGGEIVIKKDQVFFLNFKIKDEEDENLPNYEYVELDNAEN